MKLIGFKELNGCNSCLESLHSNISDIFTGDTISYENRVLGDNEYVWSDELIYYVEKYNAKLPNEFVNHILKSY